MGISNHFIHTCDIQRHYSGVGNENAHGLSDKSLGIVLSGIRFRLVEKEQRILKGDGSESAVVTIYKGFFDPGTDIEERDELVNITLENGVKVNEKYLVDSILTRRGRSARHLSARLKRIS